MTTLKTAILRTIARLVLASLSRNPSADATQTAFELRAELAKMR